LVFLRVFRQSVFRLFCLTVFRMSMGVERLFLMKPQQNLRFAVFSMYLQNADWTRSVCLNQNVGWKRNADQKRSVSLYQSEVRPMMMSKNEHQHVMYPTTTMAQSVSWKKNVDWKQNAERKQSVN
jgi:protein involved in temperature-dependent protein secretion